MYLNGNGKGQLQPRHLLLHRSDALQWHWRQLNTFFLEEMALPTGSALLIFLLILIFIIINQMRFWSGSLWLRQSCCWQQCDCLCFADPWPWPGSLSNCQWECHPQCIHQLHLVDQMERQWRMACCCWHWSNWSHWCRCHHQWWHRGWWQRWEWSRGKNWMVPLGWQLTQSAAQLLLPPDAPAEHLPKPHRPAPWPAEWLWHRDGLQLQPCHHQYHQPCHHP